jgi:hypothetical protein
VSETREREVKTRTDTNIAFSQNKSVSMSMRTDMNMERTWTVRLPALLLMAEHLVLLLALYPKARKHGRARDGRSMGFAWAIRTSSDSLHLCRSTGILFLRVASSSTFSMVFVLPSHLR